MTATMIKETTFTNNINGAVADINKEIEKLQEQVALIKTVDLNDEWNIDKWHDICKTSMRYNNALIDIVKTIFPKAKDITRGVNFVSFNLYGFKCVISTFLDTYLEVDIEWFIQLHYMANKEISLYTPLNIGEIKKYYEGIENGDNWKDIVDAYTHDAFYDWVKPFAYIALRTKRFINRKEDMRILKEFDAKQKESIKIQKEAKEDSIEALNKKIKIFKEKLLPELNKFTDKIRFSNPDYKIEDIVEYNK